MRAARAVAAASAALVLTGCERAPSYSILGSYFPVWLLCGVAAVALTFVVHLVLRRLGWEEQLAPPLLVYPALATALCLALWLVLYS